MRVQATTFGDSLLYDGAEAAGASLIDFSPFGIMRHFIVMLGLWGLLTHSLGAQAVRIATLQADGLKTIAPEQAPSETDSRRLWKIAETVRPLEAEVLVLEGIPNRPFALKLVELMKPATYHVALVTTFQKDAQGKTNAGASITILSKRQPFSARSAEWRAAGGVELPGGFGFAGFRIGTNTLCFYVADLPGDGSETFVTGCDVLTARKREIAAQYLAHHVQWMSSTLSNRTASFHVIADFKADPRTRLPESAVRVLEQAGFNTWLPTPRTTQEPASNTSAPGLQSTLATQLARNAAALSPPQIVTRRTLAQPLVVYDLAIGTRPRGPGLASGAIQTTYTSRKIPWLFFGAVVAVSVLTACLIWNMRRTRSLSEVFRSEADSSVVIELPGETRSLEAEADLWQERALNAGQRANNVASEVRAGFLGQLRHLLRDRLVAWLSVQRRRLLASHDSGTQLMLEMEDRLGKIHGQFQRQLETRDERIAELEQVVQAKEDIIRGLLRAREQMMNASRNEMPEDDTNDSRP